MKIAIIGPGAIGGTVAAWLAQNPRHEISVAARTAFDRLDIETPSGPITATPRVLTSPDQAGPVDWVLIATKAYDSATAASWFPQLCQPATCVAVLQNGVEHVERFSPFLRAEQILPVMVDCPAERLGPGRIRQRGVARLAVPASDAGRRFIQLFAHTPFQINASDDFKSEVWRKLCVNSAGALSAIMLKGPSIALHDGVAGVLRDIVRECVAVGRAEGAHLDDSLPNTVLEGYRRAPSDSLNSMHADRLAGRPMEIDARNGVIVRLGRQHHIPTPVNSLMVALLEAAQG